MFLLFSLSCFQQPTSNTNEKEESSKHLVIIRSGSDDILENIAHALSYKNITPERILFDAHTVEIAKEFQKQYSPMPKTEPTTKENPFEKIPSDVRTLAVVINTPQINSLQKTPLGTASYVILDSTAKTGENFFQHSTERIKTLEEIYRVN